MTTTLEKTPLSGFHRRHGATMAPVAGHTMPLHYPAGAHAEHVHTRLSAGLFDVSHMGQIRLTGDGAAAALESLVPSDIVGLETGRMRYTVLTCGTGGIIDDLTVVKREDDLLLMLNATLKDVTIAHLRNNLPAGVAMEVMTGYAMLALQGPDAVTALASLSPEVADLESMRGAWIHIAGIRCYVTRSGYTGEDGFEIVLPANEAEVIADRLAADPAVMPAGMAARDSLRMEAGFGQSGREFDETTTPVAAGLAWLIDGRRREDADFRGAAAILRELNDAPQWTRVGLRLLDDVPAREHEGTAILDAHGHGIGAVTSGGFGPTIGAPIALAYVETGHTSPGTYVTLQMGGNDIQAVVTDLPFVPRNSHRMASASAEGPRAHHARVTMRQGS